MSTADLGVALKLRETEVRLGVRLPKAFRRALEERRPVHSASRYILLSLDEVDTTQRWGVPGDGIVVARSISGGFVLFQRSREEGHATHTLGDAPFLWEPSDEEEEPSDEKENEEGCEDEDLVQIGDSFEDVLDPRAFDKQRLCPNCGSDDPRSPCGVCGLRRGETPPKDLDRAVAEETVQTLIAESKLVARSVAAAGRIVQVTTELLHAIDDDEDAARRILEAWEDMPEVEEVFANEEALVTRLRARWR